MGLMALKAAALPPVTVTVWHRRLVAKVMGVAAAGLVACGLSMAAPALRGLPLHPIPQLIHAAVTAAYVGAGAVALARRPGNVTGWLMCAVGLLWLVPDLGWIPAALPFTIATTYYTLYEPVLAHLALAFPTGRLPGIVERRLVAALYIWTFLNNTIQAMFSDPRTEGCTRCQRNLLLVDADASVESTLSTVSTVTSIVIVAAITGVIVRHWWRATRAAKYVMAPVQWVVIPAAGYIAVAEVGGLLSFSPADRQVVYDYLPLGLAVLPIGFLVGLLRTRLAYAHVGMLAAELAGPVAPGRVREVLARMLHDPDLELLYWSPAAEGYVDSDGHPRAPGSDGVGRTTARIDGESGPLAAITVDDAVLHEPGLLSAAEAMTRLALEKERLQAEVRSQLVQLRSTTARLVEAGEDARRRIERDLHDGAQQRLLALSLALGRAWSSLAPDADPEARAFLANARDEVQQAIMELRELARGIHPVLLTQEGLASALQALAERAPLPVLVTAPSRRFGEAAESTVYFLVAEAVTNAARHSRARQILVRLEADDETLTLRVCDDGVGGIGESALTSRSGLQNMRDRVAAVGGRMTVSSPPGGGTQVIARLPCG
jgi:signal transduction histidine kinase